MVDLVVTKIPLIEASIYSSLSFLYVNLGNWTRADYLQLISIIVSGVIAIIVYWLQRRLSDEQRVDHRLELEEKVGEKIYNIRFNNHFPKVQLYNAKLLNRKYFAKNKRDFFYGYPFHGAELYAANFDGLEFVVDVEEWNGKKYYKIGVIPYENILGVKPEGDGSFTGMIFYVKPCLLQKNKYSIAYKSFRYYLIADSPASEMKAIKPVRNRIIDALMRVFRRARYLFYYRWKYKFRKR